MKRALSPGDTTPDRPSKRLKSSGDNINSSDATTTNDMDMEQSSSSKLSDGRHSPFFKTSSQPTQSPFKPKSFNLSYRNSPITKLGNITLQTTSQQAQYEPDKIASDTKKIPEIKGDTNKIFNNIGTNSYDIDEQVSWILISENFLS